MKIPDLDAVLEILGLSFRAHKGHPKDETVPFDCPVHQEDCVLLPVVHFDFVRRHDPQSGPFAPLQRRNKGANLSKVRQLHGLQIFWPLALVSTLAVADQAI